MIIKAVESKGRAVERKQEVEGRLCVLTLQRNANIWSIYTIQTIRRFQASNYTIRNFNNPLI